MDSPASTPAPLVSDPHPPDPRAGRVTALVFGIVFLDLVGFGLVIPLMPFYVRRLGGDASTVGLLLSCFSLAQLVTTPLLGQLSDRMGRRPVILVSLVGNALAMGLFAAATRAGALWMVFASRLLAGATAGNLAACQASIADVTRGSERAAGMGRIGAGIGLGLVIGPVLSSEMSRISPEAPALGAAAMATVGVLATFFLFPETHQPRPAAASSSPQQAPRPTLGEVLRRWQVVAVLALYFLLFFGILSHQVSFALLTAARFHWTEIEVGRSFAVLGLVMFLVQGGLVGRLVGRYRETSLFMFGCLVCAGGMALVALSPAPSGLIAGLVLMAFGFGLTQPIVSTLASRQAGEENQGAVLGFAQSAGGLARTVGPMVGGYLFEHVSPGAPYLSGAVAALICLLIVARLHVADAPGGAA